MSGGGGHWYARDARLSNFFFGSDRLVSVRLAPLALCSLSTQCLSKESYWETPGCARV